jgi:hypothetical protein
VFTAYILPIMFAPLGTLIGAFRSTNQLAGSGNGSHPPGCEPLKLFAAPATAHAVASAVFVSRGRRRIVPLPAGAGWAII